jgi:hypothetical protein
MDKPKWGKWGTWEETESFLGKEIGKCEGADAVEKGTIRRWLEPKEFDCPIHYDEEAAKSAGYDGIVAPATMAVTYGIPPYWKPGDPLARPEDEPKGIPLPVIFDVPAPCTLSFATDIEIEFFEPMYIGDQLTCTCRLTDINHKELRVGKGAFLSQENTYKNQRGEVVAVMNLVIFRFVPPGEGE